MEYFLKVAPPASECTNTPFNGSLNLATGTPYSFAKITTVSYAKTNMPGTFGDVKYKDDDNYVAGSACSFDTTHNDTCDRRKNNLIYDVYYPSNYNNYATCPLPAVILFHAGGFMECSNYNQPGIRIVCEELAKRGYVAFSVEYRGGKIKDEDNSSYTSVQQQLAVYRACQDARGAIRSIIKRQDNETSGDNWQDPYRIGKNSIFVGGFSAGGVAAMSAAWYTNNKVYQVFQGGAGSATIQDALTSINADFYYGEPTIPYQANIKGTANMWGAISIPPNFFNNQPGFFNSNLLKPHIAFHGKLDDVFPYDNSLGKQYVDFSIPPGLGATDYNLEDFCVRTNNGSYFLDVNPLTSDLINGSSLNMRNILNFYGIANELYVDCDMKHGLSSNGQFLGDFGTTATTQNQASVYIAQRMATFSRPY